MRRLPRHLAFPVALLVLTLAACGDESTSPPCADACTDDQVCDEVSGLCVQPALADLTATNLAPRFDVVSRDDTLHVLLFDRLWSRYLYGARGPDADGFTWEHLTGTEMVNPTDSPPGVLLVRDSGIFALVEPFPGEVHLARREPLGWQLTPLFTLPGPLTALTGVALSQGGTHIVAGDADGSLHFVTIDGGQVSDPAPIRDTALDARLVAPVTVLRQAGRTVVLAAGTPRGLFSATRDPDGTWTAAPLDADSQPVAVGAAQTPGGLVAACLDGHTGALRYASGASGKVTIHIIDDEALPAAPPPALSVRLALSGTAGGGVLLAYFDYSDHLLRVLAPESPETWQELAAIDTSTPFLPVLNVSSEGGREALGIRLHSQGWQAPGIFESHPF